ncbi:MAG: hypothetical protein PHT07_06600 [Paludibacter sp.]|nr:hypothetical protein [Paludibacter sp.]
MKTNLAYVISLILPLTLLLSSCNDQNKDILAEKNLKIAASKLVIEPFDTIVLKLNISKEYLQLKYDSIFWVGDGQANEPLFNSLDSTIQINHQYFALKKSVTDYRIGKHKVYIKTYKNKIASFADSIEFEVRYPTGDFLSFNWNENKAEYLYFNPNLTQEYKNFGTYLCLIKSFDSDKYPTARFEFWGWSSSVNSDKSGEVNLQNLYDTKAERNTIRQFYHNYITQIYGKSTFLYEDSISQSPLRLEYEKRFKYKIGSEKPFADFPLEIWDTPTAHIALISMGDDDYRNSNWYKVIAEPRKF